MKRTNHRKWFLLTTLLFVMIILTGCATGTPSTAAPVATATVASTEAVASPSASTAPPAATVTLPTFNAEQLAAYDGVDGHSAYIAVDGKVYDVTNVAQWKNGTHAGNANGHQRKVVTHQGIGCAVSG